MQIFFWSQTEKIKPAFDVVPPAPSSHFTSIASFGDKEFLFRILALRLQNSGDVFAGFVSLKEYDYSRIYQWMKALDSLDIKSNFVPALASYYYSQTQNHSDNIYIINYLDEHVEQTKGADKKWWWLVQAIQIAKHELHDNNRALQLAYKMSKYASDDAPIWFKQMPAFILEDMNEGCMAFAVIEKMLQESNDNKKKFNAEEVAFMRHYIKERLAKLERNKFNPKSCKNHK